MDHDAENRNSLDQVLNTQGRQLLDLCLSARLRILNGRFLGDLLGNCTCIKHNGCSVVDYVLTSTSMLSSVNYCIVEEPTYLSDHEQTVTILSCRATNSTKTDLNTGTTVKSYQWKLFPDINWLRYYKM